MKYWHDGIRYVSAERICTEMVTLRLLRYDNGVGGDGKWMALIEANSISSNLQLIIRKSIK